MEENAKNSESPPELRSCGFLIFREEPAKSFLLMKHPDRYDLPKGHVDPGETDLECALRELVEETGICADDLTIDPDFRFVTRYTVRSKRTNQQPALKTLVIFLAMLRRPVAIQPTEHDEFFWVNWNPPHAIQTNTIDPLLAAVAEHWSE